MRKTTISNDAFLAELGILLTSAGKSGSCFITMKKYILNSSGKHGEAESVCLMRAKLGDKKISTHVRNKDVVRFQMSLSQVRGEGKGRWWWNLVVH